MYIDLTKGNISKSLIKFTIPLIAGNLLQQLYNIVDSIIVGKFIGYNALASVGSAYSLLTFLTSVIIGLCMGSSVLFSIKYGQKDFEIFNKIVVVSFLIIFVITIIITLLSYSLIDIILKLLNIPYDLLPMLKQYLLYTFFGMIFIFIYNFFAYFLRSVGNSFVPLVFLFIATITNIFLDIYFVVSLKMGVSGVAIATVIAQAVSAIGIMIYVIIRVKILKIKKKYIVFDKSIVSNVTKYSLITCMQQSVMNFGILMVQGLVNSFGVFVMAGFSAGVKIDSFAYMPLQDFGNAYSTFIAQNYGAKNIDRIKESFKTVFKIIFSFSAVISVFIFIFAEKLMTIFVNSNEYEIINIGAEYLRVEGAFYLFIGILFCLYGFYRAISKPFMSLILTVISLGLRVILAYCLSSVEHIGILGIWVSIPIGWFLADLFGIMYYKLNKNSIYKYNN